MKAALRGSRRIAIVTVLVVLVVLVGASAGVRAARAHAIDRCEASMPSFPARVIEVGVDWRLASLAYECVYRVYHGGTLRMKPCPDGKRRPTGGESCATSSAWAGTLLVLSAVSPPGTLTYPN